jgi:lysophospholipase L1-like esterase
MSNLYYKGEIISVSGGSSLAGMKICALGDSNTQYMGDNLNNRVVELTGCASVKNEGHAGCTWGENTNDPTIATNGNCVSMVNKLCNPYISKGYSDEYDIITIMYGTNSDTGGIGTSSSTDVTTTWGAMKYCFDKLLYYFRFGKIGVLLPPQRAGGIMTETVAAVKECCELYSVPYYDMSGQGQIVRDNAMPYSIAEQELPNQGYGQIYFGDNVHFSNVGKEQFYHKYAAFLRRLVG